MDYFVVLSARMEWAYLGYLGGIKRGDAESLFNTDSTTLPKIIMRKFNNKYGTNLCL